MPRSHPTSARDAIGFPKDTQVIGGEYDALRAALRRESTRSNGRVLLSDFYRSNGAADPAPVLEALRAHLEAAAHHHFNVSGFSQPELDFAP